MGLGQKIRVVFNETYQQQIEFESGVKLFQDTWENAQEKTTLWGRVVYVPPFEKEDCLITRNVDPAGIAHYGGECPECSTGKYCINSDKGVEYTAQIGDLVCCRYDVIGADLDKDAMRQHENLLIMPDGENQWLVNYRQIFMYERGGVKHAVGNNTICEQYYEPRLKSSFLILNEAVDGTATPEKPVEHHLRVIHPGIAQVKEGDIILVQPGMVQHYRLDPHNYSKESLITEKEYILGVVKAA